MPRRPCHVIAPCPQRLRPAGRRPVRHQQSAARNRTKANKAQHGGIRTHKNAQGSLPSCPALAVPAGTAGTKKTDAIVHDIRSFCLPSGEAGESRAHRARAGISWLWRVALQVIPARCRAMPPAQQSGPGRSASFPKHAPERTISLAGSTLLAQPARATAQGHFPPSWRHAVRDGA